MMNRPRILCVDDEPAVLEGLTLHLCRHFHVSTAISGAESLAALNNGNTFTIVLSDMRILEMNV